MIAKDLDQYRPEVVFFQGKIVQCIGRLLIAAGALRTAGTPGRSHRSNSSTSFTAAIASSGVTSKGGVS